MRRFRHSFGRMLHSRAGGTLTCVLLASILGGVALANPGALGGGGPGRAAIGSLAASADAEERHGRWSEVPGGGTDSVAGCRLLVAHLAGELESGDAAGLERAIGVVVRRCGRHEATGALTDDLGRLTRQLERKLAKEAARADRGPSGQQPGGDLHAGADPNDGDTSS